MIFRFAKTSITILLFLAATSFAQTSVFQNFITAKDGKLWDGGKEFRFISFNIPNLNYVEDELEFSREYPYRMPDTFEMNDAMESIKQLGGNVVRMYTIPVRNIHEGHYPTYVLAPNKFDEVSFKTLDTMMALANKTGIRIIFPFVNCWQWMGGRPQYADFRGKTQEEFWTDSTLIADVKATIKFTIERKNTVTGIFYKDDKSILCWETGNELLSPISWTKTITSYIKSLDKNHLVMDGFNANSGTPIQHESLDMESIDIISTHHYEENPSDVFVNINNTLKTISNKKVYVIGEFGFLSTPAIEKILDMIIQNDISGALTWSLRYHRKEGGFYWHSEPMGLGIYKAYHWPGFATGSEYDETNYLALMRRKAFEIQGLKVPDITKPGKPTLLPIIDQTKISWQGSAGASSYNIERTENKNGNWEVIGYNISDAEATYTALFNDVTAQIGKEYYYRVTAKNLNGASDPSNIVGPVKINHKCLIDNMSNYSTLYHKTGDLKIMTDNDRAFREVMYRFLGDASTQVYYLVPGKLESVKIFAFSEQNEISFDFFISKDNIEYKSIKAERQTNFVGQGDYGYWVPAVYTLDLKTEDACYFKIVFKSKSQIARVENYYTK
jgi:mannan endo-1,4-beta-mannosidase